MAVDDAPIIKAAFIEKSDGNPAQVGTVQQVRKKTPGLPIGAADEHPPLVSRKRPPMPDEFARRVPLNLSLIHI